MTYAEWSLTGLGGRRARGRSARQGGEGRGKEERRREGGWGGHRGKGEGEPVPQRVRWAEAWATHQSGGADELGAGEHLSSRRRGVDVGDRRRGLLSRSLSAEGKKGLRSSVPQGPALPTPGPQGPRAGRRRGRVPRRCKPGGWGPAARSAPGPRPLLTSAYLPRRRRRRRRQRRQRSKQWGWARRRGAALIHAAAPGWRRRGGRRSRSLCNNFISNHQRRTRTVTRQQAGGQ